MIMYLISSVCPRCSSTAIPIKAIKGKRECDNEPIVKITFLCENCKINYYKSDDAGFDKHSDEYKEKFTYIEEEMCNDEKFKLILDSLPIIINKTDYLDKVIYKIDEYFIGTLTNKYPELSMKDILDLNYTLAGKDREHKVTQDEVIKYFIEKIKKNIECQEYVLNRLRYFPIKMD